MVLHLSVVPQLGEEVEGEALLDTTGPTAALGGVALGDPRLDELRDLSLLVESAQRAGCQSGRRLYRLQLPHLISRCLPESMTQTQSGIVTPVSAMLVAMTTLRTPGGGVLKTALWPSEETLQDGRARCGQRKSGARRAGGRAHLECSGKTMKPALPKTGCSCSISLSRRISLLQSHAKGCQRNMKAQKKSSERTGRA